MALIVDNTLQQGVARNVRHGASNLFLEPSIDVYLDSFASTLEFGDQTYYDPICLCITRDTAVCLLAEIFCPRFIQTTIFQWHLQRHQ